MSVKEKMIARLVSLPTDYTFIELRGLSSQLGCVVSQSGNGSRCMIISPSGSKLCFHKPHSYSYFKHYQLKDFITFFRGEGLF